MLKFGKLVFMKLVNRWFYPKDKYRLFWILIWFLSLDYLFLQDKTSGTCAGGTSDNGPTSKKFFSQKHREAVLNLFPNATPTG